MNVRVSVVVPTYHHPDLLERCLAALLALDFPTNEYEVLVVDDAAEAMTKRQVERWSTQAAERGLQVRYLAKTAAPHGPAAARNLGWKSSNAEIIAFTDDDCIPELSWLKAGVAAFSDDVAAVAGRVVVPLIHKPTDYEYTATQRAKGEFVSANCFYRRTVLNDVGGFDERFTKAWCEDSDLFFTLLERDLKCISVPTAVVMHPVHQEHWGFSLAQQRENMFNALLYKKHPALYRQKIQAKPSWQYYCLLGTLLIILLGLAIHSWILMLVAFTAWLAMTISLCLYRLRRTSHTPGHILEVFVTSIFIPPLAIFWRVWGMIRFGVFFL